MGVKGLWPFLYPTSKRLLYQDLKNYVIAIDISIWLNKIMKVNLKNGQKRSLNGVLKILFKKICELLILGIKPIFVFDGLTPELKIKRLKDRKRKQEKLEQQTEDLKMKIAKKAMKEYAHSYPTQPSLSALKSINLEEDRGEFIKFNNEKNLKSKEFYVVDDVKRVDIESEEFENLTTSEKYEYLVFLHDLVKYEFDETSCFKDLSLSQIDKFIFLGKINKKIDELSKNQDLNKILNKDLPNFRNIFHGKRIFSDENQYYVFLKETGLIKPELTDDHFSKSQSIFNPNVKFNTLSFPKKNKWKKPSLKYNSQTILSNSDNDDIIFQQTKETHDSITLLQKKDTFKLPYLTESEKINLSDSELFSENKIESNQSSEQKKNQNSILSTSVPKLPETIPLNSLLREYYKVSAQSNSLPHEIFSECCCLISLCGLPYLVAPGEAEAQCAGLQKLGLCDLVSSEDSDSFLFGANHIIRGLFSTSSSKSTLNSAHVQYYDSKTISEILCLNKELLICMGMLSGCDYDDGIKGFGIVTAYKFIADYYLPNPLKILSCLKKPKISKKFLLKSKIPSDFPSERVFNSFMKPLINESSRNFSWKPLNYELLEKYLISKIGLSEIETSDSLNVLQKRLHDDIKLDLPCEVDSNVIKFFSNAVRTSRAILNQKLQSVKSSKK